MHEPAGSAVPERRQNFGVALLTRFKRYLSAADLEPAIDQFRAVTSLSPQGSVIRAAAANSLGNALSLRFDLLGHGEDLTAAVRTYEEAVQSARENSIDHAMYRANLGVGLLRRAELSHSAEDIEAAVREQEIAAADVPQTSQERIRVLAGLADSLAARASSTGSAADAERAREAYRSVTRAALERLPEQAIGSARSWGTWAAARESFPEAAEAWSAGCRPWSSCSEARSPGCTRRPGYVTLRDSRSRLPMPSRKPSPRGGVRCPGAGPGTPAFRDTAARPRRPRASDGCWPGRPSRAL